MTEQPAGARAAILAELRKALARRGVAPSDAAKLERRLRGGVPNLVPARSRIPHDAQVALFESMARDAQASVARSRTAGVAQAVAEFLKGHNLPAEAVVAPDPELDRYGLECGALLKVRRGLAEDADATGIAGAFCGIAETGTLMLLSGAARPSTLNFLPENHVVILPASRIVGAYEDGFALLRASGPRFMPRTVNFITGPSRTADIEQKIQMGAHGPRRLHVVLVEDA